MDCSDDPRSRALDLLTLALQILDKSDLPADIGAHVDVAIARLSEVLDQSDRTPNQVSQ
jgi:hypothetical protein